MYAAIGKLVVKTVVFYVRHSYSRQIRIGAGLAAVAIGIATYFAGRNVPEG
jgi:sugar phosphate permease